MTKEGPGLNGGDLAASPLFFLLHTHFHPGDLQHPGGLLVVSEKAAVRLASGLGWPGCPPCPAVCHVYITSRWLVPHSKTQNCFLVWRAAGSLEGSVCVQR